MHARREKKFSRNFDDFKIALSANSRDAMIGILHDLIIVLSSTGQLDGPLRRKPRGDDVSAGRRRIESRVRSPRDMASLSGGIASARAPPPTGEHERGRERKADAESDLVLQATACFDPMRSQSETNRGKKGERLGFQTTPVYNNKRDPPRIIPAAKTLCTLFSSA